MTVYTWVVFGHVLSAMVWVGGSLLLYLFALQALRRGNEAVVLFAGTLSHVGPRVMIPGVLGTLIFGIGLVALGPGWSFRQSWIIAGASLFLLALLIGTVYLSRIGIALQKAGNRPEQGRALIEKWVGGYRFVLLILLLAVVDMVFKPGA